MTFIGKGGMGALFSSLTEAASCFKFQGVCFAGNRYISEGHFDVIGL